VLPTSFVDAVDDALAGVHDALVSCPTLNLQRLTISQGARRGSSDAERVRMIAQGARQRGRRRRRRAVEVILLIRTFWIERGVLTWRVTSAKVVKLYLFRNITGL
jgi:hypothetical protein